MNVVALIGSPVAHSLSPAIHNAAFAALDEPWCFVAFDVAPGRAGEALAAARVLGMRGLAVTTPHKQQVAASVDELARRAVALDGVNTVVVDADGLLVGHSTDGDGFVAGLRASGVEVAGRHVAVLGGGGAARSVIEALGRAGTARVTVINRTPERAGLAAALAPTAMVGAIDDVTAADIVVNATSVGMGSDESPLPPGLIHGSQTVADIVYHPLETALLTEARAAGCLVVDGLSMLVHQAVRQHELWTGATADPVLMRTAAMDELSRREARRSTDTLA